MASKHFALALNLNRETAKCPSCVFGLAKATQSLVLNFKLYEEKHIKFKTFSDSAYLLIMGMREPLKDYGLNLGFSSLHFGQPRIYTYGQKHF